MDTALVQTASMHMDETVHLPTPSSTTRLAEALAPLLAAGDAILLSGEIGAGKSHFARALIQSRLKDEGRMEDVPSPTFTIVQTYELDNVEIWHTDLYRLTSADDVLELGLDDAMIDSILVIEWPDRLGEDQPPNACRIALSVDGDGRAAHITWHDERLRQWMRSFGANA